MDEIDEVGLAGLDLEPLDYRGLKNMLKENLIKEWILYDPKKDNGGRIIASSNNA